MPLHRTNLLFLVGGPPSPLYSPNKVVVYSLVKKTSIAVLEFRSTVLGICARLDRLVVVLAKRVVLFAISQGAITREGAYDTAGNLRGLAQISTEAGSSLLAIPGRQAGQVAVVQLPPLPPSSSKDRKQKQAIVQAKNPPFAAKSILLAHTSALSALSITPSGSLIATASIKGTLIRVYDAKSATLVHELRRGTDSAEIFSLSLRNDGAVLACASDKGTIHFWSLSRDSRRSSLSTPAPLQKEGLKLLKEYLPKYFSSSWSQAQFKLPPPEAQNAPSIPFLDRLADEKLDKPKTVEEDKVLLCWIKASSNVDFRRTTEQQLLVAVTYSGNWFSIAAFEDDQEEHEGKEEGEYGAFGACRLVEHKRFGDRDDDW